MKELFKNYKIEELVSLYQLTSDETYLEEILSKNNGLLHQWIQKYSNIPYFSSEDLYSEACEALWRAVLDYNPQKGVAFTTFLKISVFQKFNRIPFIYIFRRNFCIKIFNWYFFCSLFYHFSRHM